MTYNTIMDLADIFIIKLANFNNETNPGGKPFTKVTEQPKHDEIVELSPELEEIARRFRERRNPINYNPAMTGAGPQITTQESEITKPDAQQTTQESEITKPDAQQTTQESEITKPDAQQTTQESEQESELAFKVDRYASSIERLLESDYAILKTVNFLRKKPKELMFMRYIDMKFHELRMKYAHIAPYTFYGKLMQLLEEAPPQNLALFNPIKNIMCSTNRENIERIYYGSYADLLEYYREIGVSTDPRRVLHGAMITGLPKILNFEIWFEEASR